MFLISFSACSFIESFLFEQLCRIMLMLISVPNIVIHDINSSTSSISTINKDNKDNKDSSLSKSVKHTNTNNNNHSNNSSSSTHSPFKREQHTNNNVVEEEDGIIFPLGHMLYSIIKAYTPLQLLLREMVGTSMDHLYRKLGVKDFTTLRELCGLL